jgi:hypothetical protein
MPRRRGDRSIRSAPDFLKKCLTIFTENLFWGFSKKRKPKQKPIVLTKRRFCFDSDAAPIVRSGMRQIS